MSASVTLFTVAARAATAVMTDFRSRNVSVSTGAGCSRGRNGTGRCGLVGGLVEVAVANPNRQSREQLTALGLVKRLIVGM